MRGGWPAGGLRTDDLVDSHPLFRNDGAERFEGGQVTQMRVLTGAGAAFEEQPDSSDTDLRHFGKIEAAEGSDDGPADDEAPAPRTTVAAARRATASDPFRAGQRPR